MIGPIFAGARRHSTWVVSVCVVALVLLVTSKLVAGRAKLDAEEQRLRQTIAARLTASTITHRARPRTSRACEPRSSARRSSFIAWRTDGSPASARLLAEEARVAVSHVATQQFGA